ncbi:MAG: Na+/H+ antiporter [Proteobacteria bacterium]|nr:Na+/H+ antiporter [Pseudomonadota bacterium]
MQFAAVQCFLIILLGMCLIATVANRMKLAQPIAFLIGGIGLGSIPALQAFSVPPEYMLMIFLPPLLMEAAYFTSFRDFRANLRPIVQLALGLVVFTSCVVAFLMPKLIPGMGIATAFVLGAIISPPDAVAATSIIDKSRVPKRVVSILEGESLVNDATGLVIYQFAVAAVVLGIFSWTDATLQFGWMVAVGILLGLVIGYIYMYLFRHIKHQPTEILSTFLLPYGSYILTESLHASGVLAVVATGLMVGWRAPTVFSPGFRIPAASVWQMVSYTFNGFVFVMIGMQFPGIVKNLSTQYSMKILIEYSLILWLVAVSIRMVYVYVTAYGVRFVMPRLRARDPYPAWQNVFLIGWTGMRGVVSLATALALPVTIANGQEFPYRDFIIFLSLMVILLTIVVQGLLLPWIVHKLTLSYDYTLLFEDWSARVAATKEALKHLDKTLTVCPDIYRSAYERVRSFYVDRLAALGDGPNTPLEPSESNSGNLHPIAEAEQTLWQEVLTVERNVVINLRKAFKIGDDNMHDILREIDLLSARFGSTR